jgi:hypothetical protein
MPFGKYRGYQIHLIPTDDLDQCDRCHNNLLQRMRRDRFYSGVAALGGICLAFSFVIFCLGVLVWSVRWLFFSFTWGA